MQRSDYILPWLTVGALVACVVLLLSAGRVCTGAGKRETVRIGVLADRGHELCLEQWRPTAKSFCGASRISTLKDVCSDGACTVYAAVLLVAAGTVSIYVTQLNRRLQRALSGQEKELAERVRTEEALRRSEQLRANSEKSAAIGQAVTGTQHAIKNMLNALKGGVYLIRTGMAKDDRELIRRGGEMIEEGTDRISNVSQKMLNYAKEWRLELERADLNDLVAKICELNRQAAADEGVVLRPEAPDGLPGVTCDPGLIHMAATDVLLNSIDACTWKEYRCGESPEVVLKTSLTECGEYYVIEVRDNGCGMTEEIRRKIFMPFFSTKKARGTGLGLALTTRIINAHGGKVSVESEPGRGTRFRIHLPLEGPLNSREVVHSQAVSCS